ncbi:glycine betaine ABC transporter substrate-binding protein [Microlunatus parietis]|uniref:Osmoprotectant transport system substrate-binding protein n=1 Tax=Microlunatus parietis TaxID=682979 RepID=A0A7Y9I9X9_9ACTN|nr:glycine betaine ABC transporter substrate-binding protein [Microlunatus parietis]NYE72681.1 osmoprotectant transport system substrate-binding protein [Microlunatus parietis]
MRRRLAGPAMIILLVMIMAGCTLDADPLRSSGQASAAPDFVVGAPESAEGALLAQLYVGALQAKGLSAGTEPVGERADYLQRLREGRLALVPDHTGALLTELNPAQAASTASEVEDQLPEAAGPDLVVVKPASASAKVSFVITKATADAKQVATLDDLAKISDGTVLGGPADLPRQKYGPEALTAIYGARFASFRPYPDSAALARDLGAGTVSVGAFSGTDPVLAGDSFVRLEDPEAMVLPENVTAVGGAAIKANPTALGAIEAVHAALTTQELTVLKSQVGSGEPVDKVAAAWLSARGLG